MSSEGYSRAAYEKNEQDIEGALDRRASISELQPKFEEQAELRNKAQEEALEENKARDAEKAATVLRNLQSRAAESTSAQEKAPQAPISAAETLSDEEMQKFAEKYLSKNQLDQFGLGQWHGKEREVFIADHLRAERDDINKDFLGKYTRIVDRFNSWRHRRAFERTFGRSIDSALG